MRPDPHFTIRDIEVKRTIRRAFATAILIVGGLVAANGGSGLLELTPMPEVHRIIA
jgi:hypothetical protein